MLELRIEGITVPLLPAASLSLEINSGVFDLQVVKGAKSLPFTLPETRETIELFGGINKLQSGGNLRKTYPAELFAHGSLVLKGKFKLSKPTQNSYPGYLVAAAGSLKQDVADLKLRALDLGTTTYSKETAISRVYFALLPEENNWTATTPVSLFWSKGGGGGYFGSYYTTFDGDVSSTLAYLAAQLNADLENTGGDTAHVKNNVITIIASGTAPVNITAVAVQVGSGPSAVNYAFAPVLDKYTDVENNADIVYPVIYNPEHYPDGNDWNGYVNQIATPGTSQDTLLTVSYGPGPHYLQNISGQGLTRYSLVPMLFLKKVLNSIFDLAGLTAKGLLLEDEQMEQLLIYSNITIDQQAEYTPPFFGGSFPYPGKDFSQARHVVKHADHLPDLTVGEYLNQIRIPFNMGFFFNLRANLVEIIPLRDIINAECEIDWSSRVVPAWSQDAEDQKSYTLSFAEDSTDAVFKEKILASYTVPATSVSAGSGEADAANESIASNVSPLPCKTVGTRLVPYAKQRATTPLFDRLTTEGAPRLLFWHGLQPDTNGANYPKASDQSPDGVYSLQWNGETGLYETFWKDWLSFLQTSRRLEIPIVLEPEDLAALDLRKKVHIRGNNYLIESLKVSLPLSKTNPGTLTAWRCK